MEVVRSRLWYVLKIVFTTSTVSIVAFSMVHTMVNTKRLFTAMSSYTWQMTPRDFGEHMESDSSLYKRPSHVLDPRLAPNTVFLVWCGPTRWFQFRNYVTVMSVIRNMRPDNILFYYENLPVVDGMNYNTWFTELQDGYRFLTPVQLEDVDEVCTPSGVPKRDFVLRLVNEHGGMYVGENVILVRNPGSLMAADRTLGLEGDTRNGIVISQRNISAKREIHEQSLNCLHAESVAQVNNETFCMTTGEDFIPESIWEEDSPFGDVVRWAVYGSPESVKARTSSENPAPYVAHMIWIGGKPMDYLFYLCVLSAIYVAKFEKVYVHGDKPPSGPYWDQIKSHERIILMPRNSEGMTIYGNKVNRVAHWSDALRVEILLKYGGVYIDTDLLIVNPLSRHLFNYDAVATYDFPDRSPFPNSFSCGFMIGKRHAKFWYLFQESMKWFRDKNWEWNGLLQPYKVMERHPGLVHMDRHLQVICLHGLCHPTWWAEHKNMSYHHLNSGRTLNWRTDTNIFHFCGKYQGWGEYFKK